MTHVCATINNNFSTIPIPHHPRQHPLHRSGFMCAPENKHTYIGRAKKRPTPTLHWTAVLNTARQTLDTRRRAQDTTTPDHQTAGPPDRDRQTTGPPDKGTTRPRENRAQTTGSARQPDRQTSRTHWTHRTTQELPMPSQSKSQLPECDSPALLIMARCSSRERERTRLKHRSTAPCYYQNTSFRNRENDACRHLYTKEMVASARRSTG